MNPNKSTCADCGMAVSPGEYHPFAACLMFKACHDGDQVRINLNAVRSHAAQQDPDKGDTQAYVWTPGPDEFKDWCANWFGPDSDESYLAKAVFNLPAMAQKFKNPTAQPDPAMAGDGRAEFEAWHAGCGIEEGKAQAWAAWEAVWKRVQRASGEDSALLDFIEKKWFYRDGVGAWAFSFNECWDAGQHESLRTAIKAAEQQELSCKT